MSKLPSSIAALLESSINNYLALDPSIQDSVDALENKSVTLVLKEFSFPVYFKIEDKRIKTLSEIETKTDVSLSTSIPALFQITLLNTNDESVVGSDVEMSGDLDVGRDFRDLFKNVDIDWEEILSKYTGDVIAHKMGNSYKRFTHWLGNTHRMLQQDITEYLQEESTQLPSKIEVEDYLNTVDDVRLAVDRAEARLKILKKIIEQKPEEIPTEKTK